MLEYYHLNNAIPLHRTGRLWSDTTMIDLFFVSFVVKVNSDGQGELINDLSSDSAKALIINLSKLKYYS